MTDLGVQWDNAGLGPNAVDRAAFVFGSGQDCHHVFGPVPPTHRIPEAVAMKATSGTPLILAYAFAATASPHHFPQTFAWARLLGIGYQASVAWRKSWRSEPSTTWRAWRRSIRQ